MTAFIASAPTTPRHAKCTMIGAIVLRTQSKLKRTEPVTAQPARGRSARADDASRRATTSSSNRSRVLRFA
jgi:hypothetical protein